MLFYTAIFTVLLAVVLSEPKGALPKMFMGYSVFVVLTSSMQGEISEGSLILVKQTDPQELKTGDNITFIKNETKTVTHKITDIYENYENSGSRGFQTKGVNNATNPKPDKDIVLASKVAGKVIFVLPGAGAAINNLKGNITVLFIIFGACVLMSFVIRGLPFKSHRQRLLRCERS